MHDIEQDPVAWFQEFVRGLLLLFVVQVMCGVITFAVVRSRLNHNHKLQTTLVLIFILSYISYGIFDPATHLIGCVVGAVAMVFTIPLHAVACIERAASQKEKVHPKNVILRVAIPAALPSSRYENEQPRVQALRGAVYLATASSIHHYFEASLQTGGVIVDAMAVIFMVGGAAGALNIMSAVLGLFGILSPSPFRKPFLSTSLARFWGGRWNAPVSDALRVGLYKPLIRRGVSNAMAAMACFVCSGVAHEVILLYCGIRGSHGEWFAFFVIAGIMTIFEKATEQFVPDKGRWLFCFFSIYIPFHFLFVPVTIRTGLAHAGVRALATGNVLVGYLWEYISADT